LTRRTPIPACSPARRSPGWRARHHRVEQAAREAVLRAAWTEEPPRLDGTVTLVDYDDGWPRQYEDQAARIRGALGDRVVRLEHIGSTSVPGLAAKPIIDILLVVPDPADEDAYVPALERAGYRLVIREPGFDEHRVLRVRGRVPEVNLHVFPPGSAEIDRYLWFRDRLRSDDADRRLYQDAKRRLAGRHWAYIQDYADAKSGVVEEIIERGRT
jgi:GrpB-like predicted nucleotidyltransferase (UPF0157 family)